MKKEKEVIKERKTILNQRYKGAEFTFKEKVKQKHYYLEVYMNGVKDKRNKRIVERVEYKNSKEKEILKNKFLTRGSFYKDVQNELINEYKPKTDSLFFRKVSENIKHVTDAGHNDYQYVVTAEVYVKGKKLPYLYTARSSKHSHGGSTDEALKNIKAILLRENMAISSGDIELIPVLTQYETFR
jgi:hypothetical protein